MIVNYVNKRDAIDYIKEHYSKIKVQELNDVLNWLGLEPNQYKTKDIKYATVIKALEELKSVK